MNRFASTRSEKCASQPLLGRAQWRVGSIEEDGIRYGLITQVLIPITIATAPTIVTIQSIAMRQPRGRSRVIATIGFRGRRSADRWSTWDPTRSFENASPPVVRIDAS